jgi:hypothetical protein
LDAQNGLTFTGPARSSFSPLSAGSSVLDDLWIVVIILEQPAYALIVPSSPIRFWLLILSLQVLPQNKIKLISSEKKLPQLFDFICSPGRSARTERYQKATLSLAAHFVLLPPLLLQIKTRTDFV